MKYFAYPPVEDAAYGKAGKIYFFPRFKGFLPYWSEKFK
jgi:hypothetical protein